MKRKPGKRLLCGLCVGAVSCAALADTGKLDLSLPAPALFQPAAGRPLLFAMNEDAASVTQSGAFTKDNEGFEEPWLTGSKVHEYLGLGALALVGLTVISPKEEGGAHEHFAKAATVLAAAAATTGLIYHWDDFDFSDGFTDPDNMHMMLGALGTLAMVYAVSKAPDSGHAGAGILGGVAMGVAIKMTW